MKIFFAFLFMIFTIPAFSEPDFGEISVIDGGRQSDGTQLFGINITLEERWHTYWRLAGQNGLDPVFDLSESENLKSYEIHWPEPHLVGEEGVEAVGYYDDVRLVMSLVPTDAAEPIKLSLQMDIGVCDTQCVPVHRAFEMELNAGYSIDGVGLKQVMSEAFGDGEFCEAGYFKIGATFTLIETEEDGMSIGRLVKKQGFFSLFSNENDTNHRTMMRGYEVTSDGLKPFNCMFQK